jgi:hypothetical protein
MSPLLKKAFSALLALTLVFGIAAATATDAEAGRRGRVAAGVAAGIIGLGILGAAADARAYDRYEYEGDRCYPGPEECGYRGGGCYENDYGEEICRRGRYTCWRSTVCD